MSLQISPEGYKAGGKQKPQAWRSIGGCAGTVFQSIHGRKTTHDFEPTHVLRVTMPLVIKSD